MIVTIITSIFIAIMSFLATSFYYRKRLINNSQEIEALTVVDKSTGLYNRIYFDKIFISEFYRARRIKHPLAIIFINSDGSKDVADSLKKSLKRDSDFAAFYSENTFVSILYDTDSDGVDKVLSRFLNTLSQDKKSHIGVHVGIPDSHTSSQNMLNEANKAMLKSLKKADNFIEFSLNSI